MCCQFSLIPNKNSIEEFITMEKKVAKYKDLTFDYEYEYLVEDNLPELNKQDALDLLLKVQKCANEHGIDIYLAFGTLLGAVRDKDFIKGDKDADTYVKNERAFFEILPYLKDNGIELVRYIKNVEFSFRDKTHPGVFIDVFVLRKTYSIWGIYCYELGGFVTPKKYLKRDGVLEFKGHEFKTPLNPVNLLKFWYGDTWNIPISKAAKKYIYEVKSHHYWKITASKIFHAIFGKNLHLRPHE
jgi:hypothetical protein